MNLSFSVKHKDGTATHFIEKIWNGFLNSENKVMFWNWYAKCQNIEFKEFLAASNVESVNQKIHTIRKDPKKRWKEGQLIHFCIYPRSKNRFQFSPVIPCKSTQNICIYHHQDGVEVVVDGRCLDHIEVELLSRNDGFKDSEDFFNWFDHDIDETIIHWTDFKY